MFLVDASSESVGDEKLLGGYRRRGVDGKVFEFANGIFEAVA